MTKFPWDNKIMFHGVFSWTALHHNTLENIHLTVDNVYNHLYPSGLFMCNLLSIHSGSYGKGREVAPRTFIKDSGIETGVIHHFFNESDLRDLFCSWEFLALVEQECLC